MGIKVCHISTVHKKNDIRIFHKECKALAAAGYDVVYISPGKHLESEGGVILRGSGMPAGWHKARRLTAGCRITIKAALAEDADIYHIHDGELSRFIKRLKKAGSNVVYDSHEHLPMQIFEKEWIPPLLRKPVSRIADIVEMRSVRNADLIIAVADKTVERFQNLGIKIIKLENLPILGEFEGIRIDPAVRAAGRKVCYSGTIWIERGLDTMCAAVREMGNRCFLEIAGRIDHGNPAKFTGGSDSNIRYSGYLSRDELFRVYEESAAGLCLFKPFPNNMIDPPTKIYEYMATGLPVVASNFKSMADVVEKYKCGICVDPLNTEEIKNAIQYILDHPAEASEMGRNGLEAIRNGLNWEMHSHLLLEAYSELTGGKNG